MHKKHHFFSEITFQACVIILLAAGFYLYEFILQVSPAVFSNVLLRDFATNATGLGAMSGCFYYSYTVMQLPAGLLLDRFNARFILTLVCIICAFGALLFSFSHSIAAASVARFIMGGASAFAFISVLHLAVRWIPAVHFAFFAGIAEMMGSIGAIGGSAPLAILLNHFTWRIIMFGFAIAGLGLAILIFLIVKNHPANLDLPLNYKRPKSNGVFTDVKIILRNRETWFIGLYSFFIWAPVLAFSALWGVSFLTVSCKLSNIAAAQAIAFVWLGVALSGPAIGWLSDVIKRRCVLMTICALFGAVSMMIVIFVVNMNLLVLYVLMFVLGFASAGQTLSFALIRDNNSPLTNSAANGFNNMVVVAGGFLFQPLIGRFLDFNWHGAILNGARMYNLHSYQQAFIVLPACYFIAALSSMLLIRETRCISRWND